MLPSEIGPYRILRLLGEGGMGGVYEGIEESIGRRVAIKVLWPQHAKQQDSVIRFFNEARAVNMIDHPSIVQVFEFGQTPDGTAYLVMECLRGEPLSARMNQLDVSGKRLRVVEAAQIAAQIADALGAAHSKGIVHRDLKPSNVMLVPDPVAPGGERAKILDFGIAKLAHGQGLGTATNAVMGTPQYMSPEQCRGAGGVDDKTDVYSLGVMLYQMLAGRPPFIAETPLEYMGQHAFQQPPDLRRFAPEVPSELYELVHSLLTKEKSARPAMQDARTRLVDFVTRVSGTAPVSATGITTSTTPSPIRESGPLSTLGNSLGQTLQPAARRRTRRMLGIAGGVLVLVGAFGVIGRSWWGTAKVATPASTGTLTNVKTPGQPAALQTPPPPSPTSKPLAPTPTRTESSVAPVQINLPSSNNSSPAVNPERPSQGRTVRTIAGPKQGNTPARHPNESRGQPARRPQPLTPTKRSDAYED